MLPQKYSELGSDLFLLPAISSANAFAPSHSACTKEMILFASSSKPFSYTAKGSVRGGAILKEYAPEIENLYQAVDDIKTEIEVPSVWNNDSGRSKRLILSDTELLSEQWS